MEQEEIRQEELERGETEAKTVETQSDSIKILVEWVQSSKNEVDCFWTETEEKPTDWTGRINIRITEPVMKKVRSHSPSAESERCEYLDRSSLIYHTSEICIWSSNLFDSDGF